MQKMWLINKDDDGDGDDKKENETKNGRSSLMDTKSLEIRYDSFMNQYVSSMHFLKKSGFDTINQDNEKSLKSLEWKDDQNVNYKGYYNGDFYYEWNDIPGLNSLTDEFNNPVIVKVLCMAYYQVLYHY